MLIKLVMKSFKVTEVIRADLLWYFSNLASLMSKNFKMRLMIWIIIVKRNTIRYRII